MADLGQAARLKLPINENSPIQDTQLLVSDDREKNLSKLTQFVKTAGCFIGNIEGFLEAIKTEEESSRLELMGVKLKAIKAQHQFIFITLAQLCFYDSPHNKFAEALLSLDLRIKIANNEIGELIQQQGNVSGVAQPLSKLQLLPYLQSLFGLFK